MAVDSQRLLVAHQATAAGARAAGAAGAHAHGTGQGICCCAIGGRNALAVQGWWTELLAVALRRRQIGPPIGAAAPNGAPAALAACTSEHLRRRLTAVDLTLIGVGASVGSGIFVVVGVAVRGTGPAVCLSFLLAAVSCIFSALCCAELAAKLPVSGNIYLYAHAAYGELAAFLFGANVLVDFHVGAALCALSCAKYLQETLKQELDTGNLPHPTFFAVIVLAVVTGTLCVGVEHALGKINGLLVTAKIAIVLIIIFVGSGKVRAQNLRPFMPFGPLPVASMSATCMYSYLGFSTVASAAEECKNPQRDLPIGIAASLTVCAALYVCFSLVLCGIVPYAKIDKAAPVVTAFGPNYANIPWVAVLVDWGAIIGILTTLLAGLYSQARMYLAMARDGLLCEAFGVISPRFGTPVRAQLLCGGLAMAICVTLPLENLVNFLNIGVLASYIVVCGGVLVLRSRKPASTALRSLVAALSSILVCTLVERVPRLGVSPAAQGALRALAAAVAILTWAPLLRQRYVTPTTFACPLCPVLPVLGIGVNGYMLSQCHWEAWTRLGVTTVLFLAAYAVHVRRGRPPALAGPTLGDIAVDGTGGGPVPEPTSVIAAAATCERAGAGESVQPM